MKKLKDLKNEMKNRANEKISNGGNKDQSWNEARSEMNEKYGHGWRNKYDESPRSRFLNKGKY